MVTNSALSNLDELLGFDFLFFLLFPLLQYFTLSSLNLLEHGMKAMVFSIGYFWGLNSVAHRWIAASIVLAGPVCV